MNKDLKYIYPVSRVGSIERLLKVTAHNAFFVVSPLNVPKSPTHGGASDVLMDLSHSPQLYRRYSINPKLLKNVKQQRKFKDDSYNPESSSASYNPDNGNHETQHVPLVFHGIILRSQLVELLRNRIFFSENLGVSSQPTITHLEMTKDYPRYKSIYDVTLTEDDKQMLMDVSLYMNPCPYTISHHAPLARTFNLFRTMGLRHLPVLEDSGIVSLNIHCVYV
jgi:chloride channel 6